MQSRVAVNDRSRNAVGVYDRPHPLRTRKVIVPVLAAVAAALVWAAWAYFG